MAGCPVRDGGRFLLAEDYVKKLGFRYDRGYILIGVENSGSSIMRCFSRQLKQSTSGLGRAT
jgi:hypothetical protein